MRLKFHISSIMGIIYNFPYCWKYTYIQAVWMIYFYLILFFNIHHLFIFYIKWGTLQAKTIKGKTRKKLLAIPENGTDKINKQIRLRGVDPPLLKESSHKKGKYRERKADPDITNVRDERIEVPVNPCLTCLDRIEVRKSRKASAARMRAEWRQSKQVQKSG